MIMADTNAVTNATNGHTLERDFSKVVLTLENVLVPDEKLSPTPSALDGLESDLETELRILGCELIQTSGCLLKLPQVAMACGQVLYQRFYYSKSFIKHDCETVAMACINLAAKIEESPRRMRDVINVFHHIKQVRTGKTISPLILDQNYIALKNKVIKAERRILKELGFCVHVKHPHKIIVTYLQVLECENNSRLVQLAWNYMNDSFRTDVFLRHSPEAIACACIHLAARNVQIPLPTEPAWFRIFSVDDEEINSICISILQLYNRPKVNMDGLEKKVNDIKKIQQEAKKASKGLSSEAGTPNSMSQNVSPKPASPLVKKVRSEDERSDNGHDRGRRHNSRERRPHRSASRSPTPPRRRYKYRYSRSRTPTRSRSRSHTPPPKRSKRASPTRKYKKDRHSYDRGRKARRSYSRSFSRSYSRSPKRKIKKTKGKYRSRSRSP